MDTGAGADKNGNGHADPQPSDQSAAVPKGAPVPAPVPPTNGKHADAAAAGPAKDNKATQFKSGDARQNPGGVSKAAREGQKRLATTAKKTLWVFDDTLKRYRRAKKAERTDAYTTEEMMFEVAANAKDNGRTMSKLADKLYPDATPIAAQVQISNLVPVTTNHNNDGRSIVPHLADPGVRGAVVDLVAQLEARGAFTRGPGPGRN